MGDRLTLWVASLAGRMRREDGQAVVEYAVLLALILVAAIVTIGLIGGGVNDTFQTVLDNL
jgi:Flp pilus assembly pilin Flp